MEPGDLPGYLRQIQGRVNRASLPVALAMAQKYKETVQRNLALSSHAPFTFTPSPPGFFPSQMTGNLRRSVMLSGAGGSGALAYASVSATAFYAAIQEYGHDMFAHNFGRPMTWYNGGRWWSKYEVHVPPRPYMHPTTINMIASGSLQQAAVDAFSVIVWGE